MSRDRGSATVWVLLAMAVVVAASAAAIGVGMATVARHRATAAADSAALRVAMSVLDGPVAACAAGAELARANSARLTDCEVSGADAVVRVVVTLPGVLRRFGVANGRARAGPASELSVVRRPGWAKSLQRDADTPETDKGSRTNPAS
ncbi:MAG: flp pilus-assembly TadE/G-like family protein [Frankiaceae bacterium]|nr:flp pilus-assembly TadE/G-like family protein [Frankiaceae bacterium]MBV9869897.1 flp pilus-assembly TadE/G-like family protein [Frankiaceae bacterium]